MLYENLGINSENHLTFSGVDTVKLAEEFGTPAYILDEDKIRERVNMYKAAMKEYFGEDSIPLFAGKALCFKELYRILAEEKIGIDVVSSGEIFVANSAGFPMEKAFFHGNNKTDEDISYAIDSGVGYFVCDNLEELESLNNESKSRNITQKILLRITPGIDPHTHTKINTGRVDSKFGAAIETGQAFELVEKALSLNNLSLEGFHCHVGSQIFDIQPFVDGAKIMLQFIADVNKKFSMVTKMLNLGGGMGVRYVESDPCIDYEKNIKEISEAVTEYCGKLGIGRPTIFMEPGRSIVADAGITLYSVGTKKEIPGFKNYVSIDGGMTDNPRYTLYGSDYTVLNASRMNEEPNYECTIAGRCCESGDLIQENVKIVKPERGDIAVVLGTGAYNYSMASNYNWIAKPPIVMIKDKKPRLVVKRETFESMTSTMI